VNNVFKGSEGGFNGGTIGDDNDNSSGKKGSSKKKYAS
jgi:hypothetical protein